VAIVEKKAPLGIFWESIGGFLGNRGGILREKWCVMALWLRNSGTALVKSRD
jgi:hypothetical protein